MRYREVGAEIDDLLVLCAAHVAAEDASAVIELSARAGGERLSLKEQERLRFDVHDLVSRTMTRLTLTNDPALAEFLRCLGGHAARRSTWQAVFPGNPAGVCAMTARHQPVHRRDDHRRRAGHAGRPRRRGRRRPRRGAGLGRRPAAPGRRRWRPSPRSSPRTARSSRGCSASEIGVPFKDTQMEVGGAAAFAKYRARTPLPVDVVHDDERQNVVVRRKPIGVVGAILPWNAPVLILAEKVASAFAAGNTVVVKTSPLAPLAVARVGRAAARTSSRPAC